MKASFLKALVVTFAFGAVGLLALSPSKAADSSSASGGGMGACCGSQTPAVDDTAVTQPTPLTCGAGTHLVGRQCVRD